MSVYTIFVSLKMFYLFKTHNFLNRKQQNLVKFE